MALFDALAVLAVPVRAVDTTWTLDGDGFWHEPANWDNGFPADDTFDAVIDDGDTAVTVTLFGFGTVGTLELGTDDTLIILPQFGQFPTAGLSSANGFTNDGTIVLSGTFSPQFHNNIGYSTIADGTLVNGPNGLIDFALSGGPNNFQTIDGNLTNLGTVLVRGGGVAQFTRFGGGGAYANNGQHTVEGRFQIDSGTFDQADGALDVSGRLIVESGGVLNLTGGEMNLSNELEIATNGQANLLTGGVLNMTGNGIVYNSGTFTQDGGTLDFVSLFFSGGTYRYLGGIINGTPLLTHNPTLEIGSMATDPVSFLLNSESEFVGEVHAGQILAVQSEFAENASLTSATGCTNNGTIRLTSTGSGMAALSVATGQFTNGPTGLLHFQTGGTGSRNFTGDLVNYGTVRIDQSTLFNKPSGQYTNNGQVLINRNLNITDGGVLTNAPAGVISGDRTLTSALNNAGTVRATGNTLNVAGTSATNSGVFEALDTSTLNVTAPLTNLSGGVLTGGTYRSVATGGAATMTIAGSPVITTSGSTIVELSGAGATISFGGSALASSLANNAGSLKVFNGQHFNMAGLLANSGTVHLGGSGLADGTLTTAGPFTNTGTLTGHGTIHGDVMNTTGAVAPGSSPGTLHIDGDYTQGAMGQLIVELASTANFDRLLVDDAASLDGALNVSLFGGFAPAQDNVFVILTAASVTGTFDEMLPPLIGDLAWKVLYEAGSVSLISYLPGDYNRNGVTDAADFVVWRNTLNQSVARGTGADGDFDGQITPADHDLWRAHFGQMAGSGAGVSANAAVPEPATFVMLILAAVGWCLLSATPHEKFRKLINV
jgi:hypothetical protein